MFNVVVVHRMHIEIIEKKRDFPHSPLMISH